MPTVHEALLSAPVVRSQEIKLEDMRSHWDSCKTLTIKTASGGAVAMDGVIAAALIWRSEGFRRFAGLTPSEVEQLVLTIQKACRNCAAPRATTSKVAAIHSHILNIWG